MQGNQNKARFGIGMNSDSIIFLISDTFTFADFIPMSSDESEPEEEEEDMKKIRAVRLIKSRYEGILYFKFSQTPVNLKAFRFEGKLFRNVFNIFDLRKRLYSLRNPDNANFKTIFGNYIVERNLGKETALDFHSNFDSGNLRTVTLGDDGIYYIEMAADTNSDRPPNWFHFIATHCRKGEKAIFRIINYSKKEISCSVCYWSKVANTRSDTGWERLPTKSKYFSNDDNPECLDSKVRRRAVGYWTLEFEFEFQYDDDQVTLAPCYPYTCENLTDDEKSWEAKGKGKKDL